MPSLRKSDDIKAILEVRVGREVFTHHVNLFIGILKETVEGIFHNAITYLNRLGINARDLALYLFDNLPQTEGIATTVTWGLV